MTLSRVEKEKLVLELYYNKDYRYRDIVTELKMSPNQIRDIIRRHDEKISPEANKKKELSLFSNAYKLFSRGKTNLEVVIMLDIPQIKVTQFHSEYWKLVDQDELATLYATIGDRIFSFLKLYKELIIKRRMSYECVADIVDIAVEKLPRVEILYERAKQAADRQKERFDYLENRIRTLNEEKRSKTVTLPYSSYYFNDRVNYVSKSFPYLSSFSSQSSSLPYWPSGHPDLSNESRNEQENSR